MQRATVFTAEELYVLTHAARFTALIGCPEVAHCQFSPNESTEKAIPLLQEKEILTEKKTLTEKGFRLIQYIETYCMNTQYWFVERCVMAFHKQLGIGFMAVGKGRYQLMMRTKKEWIKEILLTHSKIRVSSDEKPIHRKIWLKEEAKQLLEQPYTSYFSFGKVFLMQGEIQKIDTWIFVEIDGKWYEQTSESELLYEASAGVLCYRLFDVFNFPVEEGSYIL